MKKLVKLGVTTLTVTALAIGGFNPVVSNGVLTFGQSNIVRAAENEVVNIILTETGFTVGGELVELDEYHYSDAIVGSTYNFTIHDHPGYRLNYWKIDNNVGNDIGYGETTGVHSFVVPEEHGSYISIRAYYDQIPPTGQTPPTNDDDSGQTPPDSGNNNNVMPPNGGGEQTPPSNNDGGDTVSPDNNGGQTTPNTGDNNNVIPPSNGGEQTPPKPDTDQPEGPIVLPELPKEDSKKDEVKKDLEQPKAKDLVVNPEKPKDYVAGSKTSEPKGNDSKKSVEKSEPVKDMVNIAPTKTTVSAAAPQSAAASSTTAGKKVLPNTGEATSILSALGLGIISIVPFIQKRKK